ncbi:hypothetical protein [Streptacidiphilus anmyonensis]|uniref:hypothetical protein n=1 Tax=Streptacidiphilus anmyonensis TaxID=405782 RepID=UPI0005AA8ADA|nr:hypothetical protein [Streptacidiphilus anmyonensis]
MGSPETVRDLAAVLIEGITAAMVWHGRTPWPTLIAELPARGQGQLAPLVRRGFTTAVDLHQAPREAPGWSVRLLLRTSTLARAQLSGPSGPITDKNALSLPPGFLEAVGHLGQTVLYLGEVNLSQCPADDQAGRLAALTTAAAQGHLIGARCPART